MFHESTDVIAYSKIEQILKNSFPKNVIKYNNKTSKVSSETHDPYVRNFFIINEDLSEITGTGLYAGVSEENKLTDSVITLDDLDMIILKRHIDPTVYEFVKSLILSNDMFIKEISLTWEQISYVDIMTIVVSLPVDESVVIDIKFTIQINPKPCKYLTLFKDNEYIFMQGGTVFSIWDKDTLESHYSGYTVNLGFNSENCRLIRFSKQSSDMGSTIYEDNYGNKLITSKPIVLA